MSYMGFTLNNITMLGLILAIGIVIDDAVVVHENIFRHMEEDGLDAMAAPREGHQRDRPGRAGDQPVAGRDLPAGRLHGRHGRPVLQQLRPDRRLRDPDEPVRLVHADADAVLAASSSSSRPRRATPSRKSGFIYRIDRQRLRLDAAAGRCAISWVVVVLCACWSCFAPCRSPRIMGVNLVPRDDQSEFEVTIITPEGYTLERADQVVDARSKRGWRSCPASSHRFTVDRREQRAATARGRAT